MIHRFARRLESQVVAVGAYRDVLSLETSIAAGQHCDHVAGRSGGRSRGEFGDSSQRLAHGAGLERRHWSTE